MYNCYIRRPFQRFTLKGFSACLGISPTQPFPGHRKSRHEVVAGALAECGGVCRTLEFAHQWIFNFHLKFRSDFQSDLELISTSF